jgi:hypothetical protein
MQSIFTFTSWVIPGFGGFIYIVSFFRPQCGLSAIEYPIVWLGNQLIIQDSLQSNKAGPICFAPKYTPGFQWLGESVNLI